MQSPRLRIPFFRLPALSIGAWVLLALAAHLLLWASVLAFSRDAPALDSAEQLVWSYALEGGYWKHPPLPSWLMHGLAFLFGRSVALPAVAAQACVAVALLLTWRLGCAFMSPRASLLAMGLTALVGHHNLGAEAFNHNTVLLPFQAGMLLLFHRAVRTGRWWYWLAAGACAGLALLVKYVVLFPLAALLLYLALDRACWTRRNLAGLLLAAAALALVTGPHVHWLLTHDFPPLRYAREVAVQANGALAYGASLGMFLLQQAVRLLPLLALALWMRRLDRAAGPAEPAAPADERLFLYVVGLAPLALILLYSVATGTELVARWGSNVFLLAGWMVLDQMRARGLPPLRRALGGVATVNVALCLGGAVLLPLAGDALATYGRSQFPGAALEAQARQTWAAHVDAPLRLVVSDAWSGGNLAAHRAEPLAVLLDGTVSQATWLRDSDVSDCGALVLVNHAEFRPGQEPPPLAAQMARAPLRGEWFLPWPTLFERGGAQPGTRIAWGIVPPTPGGRCRL